MRPSPIQPMSCDALLLMRRNLVQVSGVGTCVAVWEGIRLLSMSVTAWRATRLLADLAAIFLLVSCSGNLPNTAVSDDQAERDHSALSAATPIASLLRER